ncbi:hypothetical protein BDW68DRAFT_161327 [Aspergillus falconensis]
MSSRLSTNNGSSSTSSLSCFFRSSLSKFLATSFSFRRANRLGFRWFLSQSDACAEARLNWLNRKLSRSVAIPIEDSNMSRN